MWKNIDIIKEKINSNNDKGKEFLKGMKKEIELEVIFLNSFRGSNKQRYENKVLTKRMHALQYCLRLIDSRDHQLKIGNGNGG